MIKNWKLEITENETKLIIQDGAALFLFVRRQGSHFPW